MNPVAWNLAHEKEGSCYEVFLGEGSRLDTRISGTNLPADFASIASTSQNDEESIGSLTPRVCAACSSAKQTKPAHHLALLSVPIELASDPGSSVVATGFPRPVLDVLPGVSRGEGREGSFLLPQSD